MVYSVIAILVICIIVGIVKLVVALCKFLLEHKGISITAIIIIGIIIYCIKSKHPFEFLLIWCGNIKDFLWRMTYQNTVLDSILIFTVIVSISYLIVYMILSLISKESARVVVCTVLTLLATICSMFIWKGVFGYIEGNILLLGIAFLWIYEIETIKKIGPVEDVINSYILLEKSILRATFVSFISMSPLESIVNEFWNVSIPFDIISMGIVLLLVINEVFHSRKIYKGYNYINEYVKATSFFSVKDFDECEEFAYLSNYKEYLDSVISILGRKKRIFPLSLAQGWYLNQRLQKEFEKCINANCSSEEINSKIDADFRTFKYETIYKAIFEQVKGYSIDFTESEGVIKRRKSEVGVGAMEFVLMRYPIKDHPIIAENDEIKGSYIAALNQIIDDEDVDTDKWNAKLEEFKVVFKVEDIPDDGASAIELFSNRVVRKINAFRKKKTDYSFLLLLEAIYFKNLLTDNSITYQEIENVFGNLKIRKKHRDFIYQYIKAMFIAGDIATAEQLLQSKLSFDIKRVLEYIHHNIMWNEKYVVAKQFNVAVCATMSAGKSTFINAMLGEDYIPAKNEACTAKITTIRDNDNLDKLIGCYIRTDNSKVYSNVIGADVLSAWNEDISVKETILEGDIEEVNGNDGVLVVHDTPGTNNSEDGTHHDTTIDFLKENKLDLIVYLINAEYISANDSEVLLKEIQEIIKSTKTNIVFCLNKIDSYDEESENLEVAIQGLIEQLKGYGFEMPVIFPISANAARLFKLAIKGKELTKREKRSFNNLLEFFSTFDASSYVINAPTVNSSMNYSRVKKDKKVIIDDQEFSYNSIVEALEHTGMLGIENWLGEQLQNMM